MNFISLYQLKFTHNCLKSFSIGKTLLTVKRGQGEQNEKETQTETKECHHSGSQTGIECMAFELGNVRII